MHTLPVALTIAGSDPSGGAGIQADLKTFHQLGVYGTAAITLITVQNTRLVSRVEILDANLVSEQIDAVLQDLHPKAIKTGALGSADIIEAVASLTFEVPLVVDPVMISKHGAPLMNPTALEAFRTRMLARATLLTPNLHEAAQLAGIEVLDIAGMRQAALRIAGLGAGSVLIKGGHLVGDAIDLLYYRGEFNEFPSPRIETQHTHGTGCTYSAAITAMLARGHDMHEAVRRAKIFISEAIRTAPGLGSGCGPVNHWAVEPDSL